MKKLKWVILFFLITMNLIGCGQNSDMQKNKPLPQTETTDELSDLPTIDEPEKADTQPADDESDDVEASDDEDESGSSEGDGEDD